MPGRSVSPADPPATAGELPSPTPIVVSDVSSDGLIAGERVQPLKVPSLHSSGTTGPRCGWCGGRRSSRSDARYCSRRCRQAAFRLRRRRDPSFSDRPATAEAPPGLTFCYADPPYPGLAKKRYGREPDYRGEVDHRALVASLTAADYAGWALSTSSRALRDILPLCPASARVCAWVKPIGVWPAHPGLQSRWEALIVVGGRHRPPGVRDWLRAQPARGWGSLIGRKPVAFCAWLFDCLGMVPGDTLVDLFPGTGAVTRAWAELSSRTGTTRRGRRICASTWAARSGLHRSPPSSPADVGRHDERSA